ncbi:MAG TPA: type IV pilus biogenesis/stability protein PilW [Rudaea sp.]|nr:type IV pilus biogenesis/stability protein PilW [Rudaea sp.]
MRPSTTKLACAALLAALMAGCMATGGTRVSDNKNEKREDAARVRTELGERYMQQAKYELALENLQKALEYDPNYVDAHTVMAVLYERLGNTKEAGDHYARAADLAPKSGAANNNYGQFLCASGRFTEAQKYFSRAMEDPFYKTPDVLYTNAGMCLIDHDGSQVDQAETDFRKALEANPKNAAALYYMAKTLYAKNDYFRARAFIQRFEAVGHPSPDALLLARNIESKLGNTEGAREYAQRLHEQFPDSEQTHSLDNLTPASH